jgi:hypothetical protein
MENSPQEASMKSMFKMLGLAAFLGLGISAAQAGGYVGDEREFYQRSPDFHHNCFDNPRHPACRPKHRPHYQGQGFYVQPGIQLEFRFGNVHPQRRVYHPRPIIRKVRFCSNSNAVHKAQELGIRRIRAFAFQDYIVVKGRKRGHRVEVTFSRQPGCPVIQY